MSSRQVRWAQEPSRFHFRIDYRQRKANGAADAYLIFLRGVRKKILKGMIVRLLQCLDA